VSEAAEARGHAAGLALTQRQAAVYAQITAYHSVTHEGCPATYLARRLQLHHETVRDYFAVLFRKGWLERETSPAVPRVGFLTRKR
jgi:predicted DNA-binding transcriptional regulator